MCHKPIIREFNKRKVHSPFIDNIWAGNLTDIQSIIKVNKGFRILLCVIEIYSKYAWVIPLKHHNYQCFSKILDESNRKPNKISPDKGSEF